MQETMDRLDASATSRLQKNTLPVRSEKLKAIEAWIRSQLASALDVAPDEIGPSVNFKSLGLDSVVIVELAADLEEWTGLTLAPTLFYDHPTLEKLMAYLGTVIPE